MSKSSSLKTVTLLPGANAKISIASTRSKLILPALKFINAPGEPAIFQLKDGDFRQIFEIAGINLIDAQQYGERLEEQFKSLLDESTFNIQIVLTSRPFAIGSRQQLLEEAASINPYYAWYSDYLFKWFSKVAEVSCLPKLSFYLVVTIPAKQISAKSPTALNKAISNHTARLQQTLVAMEQKPRLLDREEVRTLIAQTFVSPSIDSQQDTVDETPECIAPSTVDTPSFEVKRDCLEIGNLVHQTCTVSQLPTKIWWGWLLDLICRTTPFTLSLHFKTCNQTQVKNQIKQAKLSAQKLKLLQPILDGKSKAVDLSCYLSTYSDAKSTAALNLAGYKGALAQRKAIATNCIGKQDLAWRACLPLGLDEVGQVSRISSEIAAASWPAVRVVPRQVLGLPFGFGLASREPYFIALDKTESYLLTGSKPGDISATTAVLAMRFLSLNKRVVYMGASEAGIQLTKITGPALCSTVSITAKDSAETGKQDCVPAQASDQSLFYLDLAKLTPHKYSNAILERLSSLIKAPGLIIILEDIGLFLSTKDGKAALKTVLQRAHAKDCQVFAGVTASMLKAAPELWHEFKNQIVLSPDDADKADVYQYLNLSESIYLQEDPTICLMVNHSERCLLRLTWSPMEVGIVLRGQNANQRIEELTQLRHEIYSQVLSDNPKLSQTDAWRQTIYKFGLRCN